MSWKSRTRLLSRQALAKAAPDDHGLASSVAWTWLRLDDVLWDQGDFAGVLDGAQHALDINKKLVEDDSSNSQWKRNLAESCAYAGNALNRLSRPAESRQAYEAALAIRQALAKAAPDDHGLASSVAWTANQIRSLDQAETASSSNSVVPAQPIIAGSR
jgi:tetratricopeptide (TPR) repeat protein